VVEWSGAACQRHAVARKSRPRHDNKSPAIWPTTSHHYHPWTKGWRRGRTAYCRFPFWETGFRRWKLIIFASGFQGGPGNQEGRGAGGLGGGAPRCTPLGNRWCRPLGGPRALGSHRRRRCGCSAAAQPWFSQLRAGNGNGSGWGSFRGAVEEGEGVAIYLDDLQRCAHPLPRAGGAPPTSPLDVFSCRVCRHC
jgi:hypothetical protein